MGVTKRLVRGGGASAATAMTAGLASSVLLINILLLSYSVRGLLSHYPLRQGEI